MYTERINVWIDINMNRQKSFPFYKTFPILGPLPKKDCCSKSLRKKDCGSEPIILPIRKEEGKKVDKEMRKEKTAE